jgi:predicted nuclease of predicted toxin-antitoxin system
MKLLLDENLPVKLKYRFLEKGLKAYTLRDMNWLGKKNGELLELMLQNKFTSFVTIDNNISYQQHFNNYPLKVAILVAKDNTYETIMEFFSEIVEAFNLDFVGPRAIIHPGYK